MNLLTPRFVLVADVMAGRNKRGIVPDVTIEGIYLRLKCRNLNDVKIIPRN